MALTLAQERMHLRPPQVRPFSMDGATLADLDRLGITFDKQTLHAMTQSVRGVSMDGAPAFVTAASAGTPMQYLQYLMPEAVYAVTAAQKIDAIVGRTIAGKWHDEEIVQKVIEHTGRAQPYGDTTDSPLSNFTSSFERRTVVRFEEGAAVNKLDAARAAAEQINAQDESRTAAGNALTIEQNRVGFYGYNGGENRTYGFLNDPYLPNYVTAPPTGASGSTKWQDKGFDAITGDVRFLAAALRTASGDLISPEDEECVLVVATSAREFLTVQNMMGQSVLEWIAKTYPKWRVESAPELDGANAGASVCYLFATSVRGAGEAGRQRVVDQVVPSVFHLVGMEQRAKGSLEVYSNATAGVVFKVPLAVRRLSGI